MKREPDYQEVLKQEFQRRVKRNSKYSLRAYARALGLSAATLSQVLSGKRIPSFKSAQKIANELGLTSHERAQFMKSLAVIQSDRTLQRLSPAFRKLARGVTPTLEISEQQFDAISDWYHYAILELTFTRGFRSEAAWIARRLGLSSSQVKKSIEMLLRLQLLERTQSGELRKAHETVTTTNHKITAPAFKRYQRQILEKAAASLDSVPIEQRCMHSMTIPVALPNIPLAKEMIREFARALCKELENGEPTEVYQLGISLYPISTSSETQKSQGKTNS